jgi:hypothetical protein
MDVAMNTTGACRRAVQPRRASTARGMDEAMVVFGTPERDTKETVRPGHAGTDALTAAPGRGSACIFSQSRRGIFRSGRSSMTGEGPAWSGTLEHAFDASATRRSRRTENDDSLLHSGHVDRQTMSRMASK